MLEREQSCQIKRRQV
jgi:hypothetical protein